jgi:hypothetical protein
MNMVIKNSHIHTIGQFVLWTTTSLKKLTLMGNLIQGTTCGAVTNENAALFRIRAGEVEALGNYFDGDSQNVPGYFELSAADGKSIVKYNTFDGVSKYLFTSKDNNAVFNFEQPEKVLDPTVVRLGIEINVRSTQSAKAYEPIFESVVGK